MSGYASYILDKHFSEMGMRVSKDAYEQYQMALLHQWMSHLQAVLMNEEIKIEQRERILREFLYGAIPHRSDAVLREQQEEITKNLIMNSSTVRKMT